MRKIKPVSRLAWWVVWLNHQLRSYWQFMVFFKAVVPGKSSTLWWMATHPGAHEQHWVDSMGYFKREGAVGRETWSWGGRREEGAHSGGVWEMTGDEYDQNTPCGTLKDLLKIQRLKRGTSRMVMSGNTALHCKNFAVLRNFTPLENQTLRSNPLWDEKQICVRRPHVRRHKHSDDGAWGSESQWTVRVSGMMKNRQDVREWWV